MKASFIKIIVIISIVGVIGACSVVNVNKQQYAARVDLAGKDIPFTTSSFMSAAKKGNAKQLQLFIDAGMDIDIHDNGTALTYAAFGNNIEAVKLLIKNGADVNEGGYWGNPLEIASYKGRYEIAEILINNGASINYVSRDGMTPLFHAVQVKENSKIVDLLLKNGADPNFIQPNTKEAVLSIAAAKGYLSIVKLLVNHGCNIFHEGVGGLTALDWALLNNHIDVAEILLKNGLVGADSNMAKLPLAIALERKQFKFAELLIKHGSNVDGTYGKLPLIVWCAKGKKNESVKFLVEHGANLFAADKNGSTALDYALQNKDTDLIKYLKEEFASSRKIKPASTDSR